MARLAGHRDRGRRRLCGVRRGDRRGRARSGVRRLVQAHDGRHGHGRDAGHELLAGRVRRRLPQRRHHPHLLHQRRPGRLELRAGRHERDHRQAVRRRRRHLREDRSGPDRLDLREVPLPRLHRRDVRAPEGAGPGGSLPGPPRPGHPRRGRRHDQGRLPQHVPVPGERPPARRLLRQGQRGRPVQRRHPRRQQGRRRRADRRHAHLRLGGARRAPGPAPTTAAR